MPAVKCVYPSCPEIVRDGLSPRCLKHRNNNARKDITKAPKRVNDNIYNSQRWRNLRNYKLTMNYLCEKCEAQGIEAYAKHVDHIVEIKDDPSKAYDKRNLMSLCIPCHTAKTNTERANRVRNFNKR